MDTRRLQAGSPGVAVGAYELDQVREDELRSLQGDSCEMGSEVVVWGIRVPCPDCFQPLPCRPVPLTPRAFLDIVAGDEGGAAGLGQPHAQSLALACVRPPHQECLRMDRVGGSGPAPLPPTL